MGFFASWAGQTNFSQLQSRALVRGLTNIAEHLFLTSTKYFQSAAARADGMLIPNLQKALFVSSY
jgi:hypothetical protein